MVFAANTDHLPSTLSFSFENSFMHSVKRHQLEPRGQRPVPGVQQEGETVWGSSLGCSGCPVVKRVWWGAAAGRRQRSLSSWHPCFVEKLSSSASSSFPEVEGELTLLFRSHFSTHFLTRLTLESVSVRNSSLSEPFLPCHPCSELNGTMKARAE